ncbi:hypothetical protein EV292_102679 [Sphingomonas sp. BK235]|nr:hypothetical protein EV292_102679 [Sphingomonas sp. BK235]
MEDAQRSFEVAIEWNMACCAVLSDASSYYQLLADATVWL